MTYDSNVDDNDSIMRIIPIFTMYSATSAGTMPNYAPTFLRNCYVASLSQD
ncbi:hypothetical protein FB446DRAFT_789103 [Lentinula raphanica]|nr:hypothetical protein FB446DRAFT_789103 [Lentinula raphanica]